MQADAQPRPPAWRLTENLKTRREFWFLGFVVRRRSRKWQPFFIFWGAVARGPIREKKKKKNLWQISWHCFTVTLSDERSLKAGLHKHSPLFIVTRHLKQWRCVDGGLVLQLRPLHVPQPERRRGQQEANEKSTCDKRERERESQNRASVMESVFPTKVSSPTVVPVLLLECSIFWKVAAPPCQLPRGRSNGGGRIDRRAEKWRMRLSDRWSSGSS